MVGGERVTTRPARLTGRMWRSTQPKIITANEIVGCLLKSGHKRHRNPRREIVPFVTTGSGGRRAGAWLTDLGQHDRRGGRW